MARTVTVYNSQTQQRNVFENIEANTLGELKAILRQKGISFEGMSVMEGVSNTQLLGDESQLPSNMRYRDTVTNDLMIFLTPSRKINSGCDKSAIREGLALIAEGIKKITMAYENEQDGGFTTAEIQKMVNKYINPTPESCQCDDCEESSESEEDF